MERSKAMLSNLFIHLLNGRDMFRAARFYDQLIDKNWDRDILDNLISVGQIKRIKHFQKINPQIKLTEEELQVIISFNCQTKNFFPAIEAAELLPEPNREEAFNRILADALGFFTPDHEQLIQINNVVKSYKRRYGIPGLEE